MPPREASLIKTPSPESTTPPPEVPLPKKVVPSTAPPMISPPRPELKIAWHWPRLPLMRIGPAQVAPFPSSVAWAARPPEPTVCMSSRTLLGVVTLVPSERIGWPDWLYWTRLDRVTLVLAGSENELETINSPSLTTVPPE